MKALQLKEHFCISVGDPRRPYPLDIEMRSGLLGKMQDRHATGRLLVGQDNVANTALSEHERTSPSLTQNGHHTQAVSGKAWFILVRIGNGFFWPM